MKTTFGTHDQTSYILNKRQHMGPLRKVNRIEPIKPKNAKKNKKNKNATKNIKKNEK